MTEKEKVKNYLYIDELVAKRDCLEEDIEALEACLTVIKLNNKNKLNKGMLGSFDEAVELSLKSIIRDRANEGLEVQRELDDLLDELYLKELRAKYADPNAPVPEEFIRIQEMEDRRLKREQEKVEQEKKDD